MKEHLIAVKWDPNAPPYAFLIMRDLEKDPEQTYKKFLSPGEAFHITVAKEKKCIGHSINKKEYFLCNKNVTDQYDRCYSCEQQDFEKCFLFCDASKTFRNCSNNPEAYEYCKTHHCSVYVALIANDVKVGVSFNPLKRWINQGADFAVEVIRAKNGFDARFLEKTISSELNIPQTISKKTKAKKLNFNLSRSVPDFREVVNKVISYIERSGYESEKSEFLYKEKELYSFYGDIPSLTSNPILNEIEKTLQVTGEIVGVKGKLLVTKVNSSFYVTNLSKIIGHLMSFSTSPLKLKGQKSLSEFF